MKRKRKYTRKIHIERLRKMLEKKDACDLCPGAMYYGAGMHIGMDWSNNNNVCGICNDLVFLDDEERGCPCRVLGKEEALKRTYLALEKEP